MNKYIYKIKNKIVSGDEKNSIITYEDTEPKFLACVPVVEPKSYTTTNEEGEEIIITPQLEISKHYPSWNSETMVMSDVEFKEPKMVEGALVEKTKYELYLEDKYTLKEGEVVENESIKVIQDPFQYSNWNGSQWIEDLDAKKLGYQEKIRALRKPKLYIFDTIAGNKANGIDGISDEDFENVLEWRQVWLDLPELVDITKTIEAQIPDDLDIVKRYTL